MVMFGVIIYSVLLWGCYISCHQSFDLDRLTTPTFEQEIGQKIIDSYARERSYAENNRLVVFSKTEVGATSFLMVEQFDNPIRAAYEYVVVTANPEPVFFTPDWTIPPTLAEQFVLRCAYPKSGNYCQIIARYGQYIVMFQLDGLSSRNFQDAWVKIDRYLTDLFTG